MAANKISQADVQKVAKLASLALDPAQLARMQEQLDGILGYVSSLDAVDVSQVEPTFHTVAVVSTLRADVPTPSLSRDEVLAQAPASDAGGFAVPKVLETEG